MNNNIHINYNHRQFYINQKTEHELVVSLYQNAKFGFLANLLCATIILFSLLSKSPQFTPLYWYGFILLIIALRYILVQNFFQSPFQAKRINLWRNLFTTGAFCNGLCWGILGTPLFLVEISSLQKTLILITLLGVAAGCIPILAYAKSATFAFLFPVLLPAIFFLFSFKDSTSVLLATTFSIFFVNLIVVTFRAHQWLKNLIQLRFENLFLLKALSKLKSHHETDSDNPSSIK